MLSSLPGVLLPMIFKNKKNVPADPGQNPRVTYNINLIVFQTARGNRFLQLRDLEMQY